MINNTIDNKKILSVFDFDGTITYYDSFVLFLYFVLGKRYFIKNLMRMILPIFWYICHVITRDELKNILIKTFLTNIDISWLLKHAETFCTEYWTQLIRPNALLAIKREIHSGAEVVICSASPTLVVQPFANKLGTKLIGTELEIKNNKLTGLIIGYNCRCMQKVIRLQNLYGNLNNYYLRVWGDTRGDYEILSIAQDAYWKHFHMLKCINKFYEFIKINIKVPR